MAFGGLACTSASFLAGIATLKDTRSLSGPFPSPVDVPDMGKKVQIKQLCGASNGASHRKW